MQGLSTTFSTVTETLRQDALAMVLLGLLVAWLAVLGLGREARTNPVSDPESKSADPDPAGGAAH